MVCILALADGLIRQQCSTMELATLGYGDTVAKFATLTSSGAAMLLDAMEYHHNIVAISRQTVEFPTFIIGAHGVFSFQELLSNASASSLGPFIGWPQNGVEDVGFMLNDAFAASHVAKLAAGCDNIDNNLITTDKDR
ncbi:hypothetical protein ACP4OV_011612 [Aristida adscensionis]